jgi:peptide/nickel transport system permease protein
VRYLILSRVGAAALLMLIASIFCFLLIVAAPGNVAVLIAEMRTAQATKADVEKIAEEYGLNDPLPVRYGRWLGDAVSGDFGFSLRSQEEVTHELAVRIPTTVMLMLGGGLVSLAIGIGLGLIGAMWPGGLVDEASRTIALLFASTPKFFIGAMFILVFAVTLQWLPSFGADKAQSWLLPCLTIGVMPGAVLSRLIRVSLEEAMSRPYAVTAKSKGFSRTRTLFHDALPNIGPILLTAFGTQFALMVQASLVVEPIFALPGVGGYFVEAAKFRDLPVVQACLLLFAVLFIVVNLAIDLTVFVLDPKSRRLGRA